MTKDDVVPAFQWRRGRALAAFVVLTLVPLSQARAQERTLDPALRELTRPVMRELVRRTPRLGVDAPVNDQPLGLAMQRTAGGVERVGVLVQLETPAVADALRAAGAEIGVVVGEVATAWVPVDALERVAVIAGVQRVEAARALTTVHDTSIIAIHADAIREVVNGAWTGATGRNVIVAIYDTGLDLMHEDFRDASGRTRVLAVWHQASTLRNPPPGFTQGFYCTREAVQARIDMGSNTACPQTDFIGHGTHVTGTAAGDGSAAGSGSEPYRFAGVAPEADIVVVNGGPGTFFENLVVEGLVFVKNLAVERGQPAVVNLSLGGQYGPHDGSRLYEQVIDELSGPGFAVVVSAGNQGSNVNTTGDAAERLIHARGVATALQTTEFTFDLCMNTAGPSCVPYSRSSNSCAGNAVELDFWYPASDRLRIEVVRPSGSSAAAPRGQRIENGDPNGRIHIDNGTAGVNAANGAIEAVIMVDGCGGSGVPQSGTWRIRVTPETAGSGAAYDMWIYRSVVGLDGTSLGRAGFDNRRIIASPGNAARAITVGAFVTRVCWPSQGSSGTSCYMQREAVGDIARFSGAGPRRDGLLKPEVAAPGLGVASALSVDASPSATRLLPDGVHWILEGTSMAAPHVTGAVAVLFQANPALDPERIKEVLQATSAQDQFTSRVYGQLGSDPLQPPRPSDWWGHGKLNVQDALLALSGASPATLAITAHAVQHDTAVVARRGARLGLLALTLESRGDEAIRVLGLTVELTGRDPEAKLLVLRDANGNARVDAGETVLGSAAAQLEDGRSTVRITPDSLRVPESGRIHVIIALEMSGEAEHGAGFRAELIPSSTLAIGVSSLARNPLAIETVQASELAGTSVLRSDQLMSLSENPVRSASVLFLFAQRPATAAVFTPTGRRVVNLIPRLEGELRAEWDLTNDDGTRVAPGVYLVVFNVAGRTLTERIIVLTPGGTPPDNLE